jgi:hypothetical protein
MGGRQLLAFVSIAHNSELHGGGGAGPAFSESQLKMGFN